jgi:hypothetical protein
MAVRAVWVDVHAEETCLVDETPPSFASCGRSWSIDAVGNDIEHAINGFESGNKLLAHDRK